MITASMFLGKREKLNRNYQKESILTADRFKEPIEDWEIEKFKLKTTDEIKEEERLFDLAKELGRTYNAMMWWYELMYRSDKYDINQHHAKNIIERFSKFKRRKNE